MIPEYLATTEAQRLLDLGGALLSCPKCLITRMAVYNWDDTTQRYTRMDTPLVDVPLIPQPSALPQVSMPAAEPDYLFRRRCVQILVGCGLGAVIVAFLGWSTQFPNTPAWNCLGSTSDFCLFIASQSQMISYRSVYLFWLGSIPLLVGLGMSQSLPLTQRWRW